MTLRLFACRVYVSPLFMATVALALLIDRTGMMCYLLAAMLLHESGHLLAMVCADRWPRQIALLPFEINIVREETPSSVWGEAGILAGGIAANLLAFAFGTGFFAAANLFLALFNALPLYSMDGYQLLSLFFRGAKRGQAILRWICGVTMGGVAAGGITVLLCYHNPVPLLFLLYMGLLTWRARKTEFALAIPD